MCGMDTDDLFAYSTTKNIKIRDARLGLLHYCLMFVIVVYIIIYQLIGHLGYLKFAAAENAVRLTLQEPTVGCNPNDSACMDQFTPIDQLAYCCAQNSSCQQGTDGSCRCDYRPNFKDYDCTWLGGEEAAVIWQSSLMVTTFIHEYNQVLNTSCFSSFPTAGNNCANLWISESGPQVFTADVEEFTILIDHSVQSPSSGLATTSREMKGMLYVGGTGSGFNKAKDIQDGLCRSRKDAVNAPSGGSPTDVAPCYLEPQDAGGLDFFAVGTLLQAMGVSLEEESYPGSGHSVRYEGLTASLVIEYSNSQNWHGLKENISYVYKPSVIPRSTFKTAVLVPQGPSGSQQRLKKDQHGILFEVKAGGELAVFDFTQLLLQLTTSLTLLAMAAVAVNLLAQYVLSKRHYYAEALYENTAEFNHLSFLERQPDAQIQNELRQRNLPDTGSKYRMILRLLEYGWTPPAREASSLNSLERGTNSQSSAPSPNNILPSLSQPMVDNRNMQ